MNTSTTTYKSRLLVDYIHKHADSTKRPLMVSMQGPQGCGKSTLAAALVADLASKGLRTAVASLDALAAEYPNNALLAGRGPPGTHDIPLLRSTLSAVRENTSVELPIFDKSLNDGYGDRSTATITAQEPVDVFLLEGWSLRFEPCSQTDLESNWRKGRVAQSHPFKSMLQINDNLSAFSHAIHHHFDIHIAIRPQKYDYVYQWRLEQEHHMMRENGGKGMSDEAVRAFVDRYMPCYELYGAQAIDRGMVLEYGERREVVNVRET